MAILFSCIEGLPKRREYLGTFLGRYLSLEDDQHLSQRLRREANNDSSTCRLRSAHGQANNLAPYKVEIRATNKTR